MLLPSWVDSVSYVEDYVPPVAPGDPAQFNAAVNAPGENRSFVNDYAHPWVVVTDSGRNCVRSDIAGMRLTETEFTIDMGYLEAGSVISFDWKTSSESTETEFASHSMGLRKKLLRVKRPGALYDSKFPFQIITLLAGNMKKTTCAMNMTTAFMLTT